MTLLALSAEARAEVWYVTPGWSSRPVTYVHPAPVVIAPYSAWRPATVVVEPVVVVKPVIVSRPVWTAIPVSRVPAIAPLPGSYRETLKVRPHGYKYEQHGKYIRPGSRPRIAEYEYEVNFRRGRYEVEIDYND